MEEFRKNVAETLRNTPREDRRQKLTELQKSDEYWTARMDKLLASGQSGEFSEDRTSLHWKVKHVYHGTDTAEIDDFNYAKESTIGNHAVYLTVDPTLAIGYAKLRGKERKSGQAHIYDVVLSDVNLMNWAEQKTVEKLKKEFRDFASKALEELGTADYKDFAQKFGLSENIQKRIAIYALKKIIETCDQSDQLHGGNIKTVAQGVMGIFFEKFVKDKGYDGVITIEGGDDPEFTAKAGISVVMYNKEKIISHRTFDVMPPSTE